MLGCCKCLCAAGHCLLTCHKQEDTMHHTGEVLCRRSTCAACCIAVNLNTRALPALHIMANAQGMHALGLHPWMLFQSSRQHAHCCCMGYMFLCAGSRRCLYCPPGAILHGELWSHHTAPVVWGWLCACRVQERAGGCGVIPQVRCKASRADQPPAATSLRSVCTPPQVTAQNADTHCHCHCAASITWHAKIDVGATMVFGRQHDARHAS